MWPAGYPQTLGLKMYLKKTDAQDLLRTFSDKVGSKLQETNEFLAHLAEEDDWSFVIKSHALIEATVTRLITSTLGDKRISPPLERLPLSDNQMGKIAIAKQLGVLDGPQRKFIKWYSELRNSLVHKVENIEFSFSEHWAGLDQNQKKAWKKTIDWSRKTNEPNKDFCKLIENQIKTALWLSILTLIGICETNASQAEMMKKIDTTADGNTKEYLDRQEELIGIQSKLIEEQASLIDELT
jgi:hypothetical protein